VALWLQRAELTGELLDLVLLLIDLGSELTVDLLELALQTLGGATPLTASSRPFGNRPVAFTFGHRALGRVRAPTEAATLHLRLGPQLGQRQRHVDPQIDQLVQLLLHLVQLLAALVQVPVHPLFVGLQGLVDLLGELASLSAAILFRLLTLGPPSALGLGQGDPRREGRCTDRQRNQSDVRHQTRLHRGFPRGGK
jgi:hypothetical protein